MRRWEPIEPDSARAWIVVVAAFCSSFTVFGIAYSFGAFFKPMAAEFGASSEATSAVFSITAFAYFLLGSVTGHLADRFGPRPVVAAGALILGVGLGLTSLISRLWLGYLTYGAGVGIGVACGYVPMVAAVGGWFNRRRNTALGIAVAGVGVGILALAPLAGALIQRYGWRATYAILGAAGAAVLLACAAITPKPPVAIEASRPGFGQSMRSRTFALLYAASLLTAIALYVPFVFLPPFALSRGSDEVAAATLVGLIGASSIVGRLGLGALADRMGPLRLYRLSFLVLGLSYGIWLEADSYGWLVVFAIVMGMGYGGYVGLAPAVMSEFFGVQGLGRVIGTYYTSAGFGALVGPPLAGLTIDRTGSYTWAIVLAFAMAMAAFGALVPLQEHGVVSAPVAELD